MMSVARRPELLGISILIGFFEADARAAAISICELDAGGFEG